MSASVSDICLIVEGSYPYVSGGVSSWCQQLIESESDKKFHIISIVSPTQDLTFRYTVPKNVIETQTIILQDLPQKKEPLSKKNRQDFFIQLEVCLQEFLIKGGLESFKQLIELLESYPQACSQENLLNSEDSWRILLNFYKNHMKAASFIDFFWAWRNLFSSLYSLIDAPLPKAKLYHAVCTGYAGLIMAKAHLVYQAPCLLTEHGIYTNERQVEITLADWIEYQKNFSLQLDKSHIDLDLKDFWMSAFEAYSKICYDSCDEIITLYEGNKDLQIANGAAPQKLKIIPNGVDYESYSKITRDQNHPPTIALIGRVVPIKDVQTFIQACILVKEKIPALRAYVMGPYDEDHSYYEECLETVKYAEMQDWIEFTGKVNLKDSLSQIDLCVLTSLSESQPLVILEAGAAGIPSVATDVGSCRELLHGTSAEPEKGGEVVEVGSPQAVAEALIHLLTDEKHYKNCQRIIKDRVSKDYNKLKIDLIYKELYNNYLRSQNLLRAAS